MFGEAAQQAAPRAPSARKRPAAVQDGSDRARGNHWKLVRHAPEGGQRDRELSMLLTPEYPSHRAAPHEGVRQESSGRSFSGFFVAVIYVYAIY